MRERTHLEYLGLDGRLDALFCPFVWMVSGDVGYCILNKYILELLYIGLRKYVFMQSSYCVVSALFLLHRPFRFESPMPGTVDEPASCSGRSEVVVV